jgi:hypothetical protein
MSVTRIRNRDLPVHSEKRQRTAQTSDPKAFMEECNRTLI